MKRKKLTCSILEELVIGVGEEPCLQKQNRERKKEQIIILSNRSGALCLVLIVFKMQM